MEPQGSRPSERSGVLRVGWNSERFVDDLTGLPLPPALWLHVYLFGGHVNRVPDSECCFCECPFFPVTFSFLRFRNRDQQYREPEYIFRFPISSSLYYEAQIMTNCSVPVGVWINCMSYFSFVQI